MATTEQKFLDYPGLEYYHQQNIATMDEKDVSVLDNSKSYTDSSVQAKGNELGTRIDNLILNAGDSSAECADARVTKDGTVHDTLKNRLDTEYSQLSSEIEDVKGDIDNETNRAYERENLIVDRIGKDETTMIAIKDKQTENHIECINNHSKNVSELNRLNRSFNHVTVISQKVLVDNDGNQIVTNLNEIILANERNVRLPNNLQFVDYEKYGLPVMYLNGDLDGISKKNKKTLDYIYSGKIGSCTLKWQGSGSLAYGKKNYTIEFDNPFEAKTGWGSHNKYCLKANWVDSSHSRNIVTARLWGKMVKSRTFIHDKMGNLINGGAIDGFPILLVINNEFQGLYTFNIPKEDWLFDMGNTSRECILCAESDSDGVRFIGNALLDGTDYKIEYISDENDTEWAKTSLNNLIQLCVNCTDKTSYENIKKYIDIESAIDYYILVSLIRHMDGVFRNFLLVTYGERWYFSSYDTDLVFGLNVGKFNKPVGDMDYTSIDALPKYNHLFSLIYRYDYELLKTRYNYLRSEIFSDSNVYYEFLDFLKDIPLNVKVEENKLWTNIPFSMMGLEQIVSFYKIRADYTDKVINNK